MLALLLVLVSWLVLSVMLIGLGLLTMRLVATDSDLAAPDLWRAFWLGLAFAIAVLQAWHLVAPVGWAAFTLLCALAGAGLRGVRTFADARRALPPWKLGLVLAATLIWLADRSLGPPVGDAGLYHLSGIRWAEEYAAVPGLANLHLRLGLNNPSHLWTALTDLGGFGSHISISVLVAAVMLRAIVAMARVASHTASGVDAYWALMLTPMVGHAVTLHELRISSPEPDTVVALVAMAAGGEFVRLASHPVRSGAFAAAVLALLAGCLKLTAAPYAGVLVALVLARGAPIGAVAIAGGGLILPWILRGLVLTGYPLYPLSIGGAPVDWRVPRELVDGLRVLISENFMPPIAYELAAGGSLVKGWLLWQLTRCPELILLPALGVAVTAPFVRPHRALLLLAPCVGSLLVWLSAPAPRFGYAFIWIAAAAIAVAIFEKEAPRTRAPRRLAIIALIGVAVLPIAHRIVAWAALSRWELVADTLVLMPSRSGAGFHPTPEAELVEARTRTGLVVFMPRNGDQVWAAPLPSSPDLEPDLSLRKPPGLAAGFAIRR